MEKVCGSGIKRGRTAIAILLYDKEIVAGKLKIFSVDKEINVGRNPPTNRGNVNRE